MLRSSIVLLGAVLLAGCASNAGPTPSTGATPTGTFGGPSVISGSGTTTTAAIAGPAGCAEPIAEYQRIIDRDVETGFLNPGVYNRAVSELEDVRNICAEGREREARDQLAALRARYGYR